MSERSIQTYFAAQESQQKFEYFVCGLVGAVFAYEAQHYTPMKLDNAFAILEPAAMLLLLAALIIGLVRLSYDYSFMMMNAQMLHAGEKAGKLTGALSEKGNVFYNEESGEMDNPATLRQKRDAAIKERDGCNAALERAKPKLERLFVARNVCFCGGLALLLAARIEQPYIPAAKGTQGNAATLPAVVAPAKENPQSLSEKS